MFYAVVFLGIALYCSSLIFTTGGWTWLLLWPASSFAIVGVAYAINKPQVFGKQPSGDLARRNRILLLPYLLLVWTLWHTLRLLKREPAHHRVNDGLTIGRRIYPRELPEGVDAVIDLTAEHSEPLGVRQGAKTYLAHPILDNHVPTPEQLADLIERIDPFGHLYVHCAEGHGRAALVSACVLLKRGQAQSADEAVWILKAKRPLVRPRSAQQRALRLYAEQLGKRPHNAPVS